MADRFDPLVFVSHVWNIRSYDRTYYYKNEREEKSMGQLIKIKLDFQVEVCEGLEEAANVIVDYMKALVLEEMNKENE